MTREMTNKILEYVDEGVFDAKTILKMCLVYMSESDVSDMCNYNNLFEDDNEEE